MSVFNIITLFGGLALFLYGMRIMGDGLKEGSTDTLKKVLEKVTNNPAKGFLVGMLMTALIQSSTATIVITSGLVGAGILTLHQSVGIILGANVGTTVTGQIIRLLDINAGSASWLNFFKPDTLAPLVAVAGILLIANGCLGALGASGSTCISIVTSCCPAVCVETVTTHVACDAICSHRVYTTFTNSIYASRRSAVEASSATSSTNALSTSGRDAGVGATAAQA